MGEIIVTFACTVLWLLMAGWSFMALRDRMEGGDQGLLITHFLMCLVLAPFTTGAAIFRLRDERDAAD